MIKKIILSLSVVMSSIVIHSMDQLEDHLLHTQGFLHPYKFTDERIRQLKNVADNIEKNGTCTQEQCDSLMLYVTINSSGPIESFMTQRLQKTKRHANGDFDTEEEKAQAIQSHNALKRLNKEIARIKKKLIH